MHGAQKCQKKKKKKKLIDVGARDSSEFEPETDEKYKQSTRAVNARIDHGGRGIPCPKQIGLD